MREYLGLPLEYASQYRKYPTVPSHDVQTDGMREWARTRASKGMRTCGRCDEDGGRGKAGLGWAGRRLGGGC